MQGSSSTAGRGAESPDIEQIEADIERTRQELGETVEALTAKLDVKTRTKQRLRATAEQTKGQAVTARQKAVELTGRAKEAATGDQGRPKPAVQVGVAAVTAVILALVVWRRRSP